ncbi:hypothetical protein ABZP36_004332 [Zizania latifolia]
MEEMLMAANAGAGANPNPPAPAPSSAAGGVLRSGGGGGGSAPAVAGGTGAGNTERRARPQKEKALNCPRCNSTNTKCMSKAICTTFIVFVNQKAFSHSPSSPARTKKLSPHMILSSSYSLLYTALCISCFTTYAWMRNEILARSPDEFGCSCQI